MNRLIRTTTTAAVGLALLLSACAGEPDTTELDAATAALETAKADVVTLEADIATGNAEAVALEADLAVALDDLESQAAAADGLRSDIAGLEAELETVRAENDELRVRFDPEIRAAADAAWNAEVASACEEAGDGSGLIASYVDHTEEMSAIGTRAELVDAVTACAEPLRNRSAAERLAAECSPGDVDAVVRDTDGFIGDCLVMYVIPWQWDSRTGECAFLGSWDANNLGSRYSYKYDGDGVFRAGPALCADGLADADQDDLLKVWVTVEGTYRYDTAAGGTNEIPDFTLRLVELVAKN